MSPHSVASQLPISGVFYSKAGVYLLQVTEGDVGNPEKGVSGPESEHNKSAVCQERQEGQQAPGMEGSRSWVSSSYSLRTSLDRLLSGSGLIQVSAWLPPSSPSGVCSKEPCPNQPLLLPFPIFRFSRGCITAQPMF